MENKLAITTVIMVQKVSIKTKYKAVTDALPVRIKIGILNLKLLCFMTRAAYLMMLYPIITPQKTSNSIEKSSHKKF